MAMVITTTSKNPRTRSTPAGSVQRSREDRVFEAWATDKMTILQQVPTTLDGANISGPVAIGPDRASIDPQQMVVDRAYAFEIDGESLAAVRRSDGGIDFYNFPK